VAYFITIVDFTIVNVALPTIGRKLHFQESDLQWVVTAYGLTYAGFVLLGGRAADLLGRRRLLMAGLVVFTAGWQYIFFFDVPIGAAALILAPKLVPESRNGSARRRYDPFGAVTITAALLALFLLIETKAEAPLLPLRLLRSGSVAGSNVVGFGLGTSFLTFVFLGTLYMQQVLGLDALATGAAWMTASVTSLACAGLSQKLVTRTSPKAVMAVASSIAASHVRTLVHRGYGTAAALTGGFQLALLVCGLAALAAVLAALVIIRHRPAARTTARSDY
jgi:MFS family permease